MAIMTLKAAHAAIFDAFGNVQKQKAVIHAALCSMVVHAAKNRDPRAFANFFQWMETKCPQEFHPAICQWLVDRGFSRKVEGGVASWGIKKTIDGLYNLEGEDLYQDLMHDKAWFHATPARSETVVFDVEEALTNLIKRAVKAQGKGMEVKGLEILNKLESIAIQEAMRSQGLHGAAEAMDTKI